ncbi:hypothetical protein GE09DRAFT_1066264 [Coniochaeta sp. 2T2.1]|nr:hypothetical protein GE09DRAFT_1066264 [Coniochaeta sp. 2T2.1]
MSGNLCGKLSDAPKRTISDGGEDGPPPKRRTPLPEMSLNSEDDVDMKSGGRRAIPGKRDSLLHISGSGTNELQMMRRWRIQPVPRSRLTPANPLSTRMQPTPGSPNHNPTDNSPPAGNTTSDYTNPSNPAPDFPAGRGLTPGGSSTLSLANGSGVEDTSARASGQPGHAAPLAQRAGEYFSEPASARHAHLLSIARAAYQAQEALERQATNQAQAQAQALVTDQAQGAVSAYRAQTPPASDGTLYHPNAPITPAASDVPASATPHTAPTPGPNQRSTPAGATALQLRPRHHAPASADPRPSGPPIPPTVPAATGQSSQSHAAPTFASLQAEVAALEAELQANATTMANLDIEKHALLLRRHEILVRVAEIEGQEGLLG